MGSQFPDQGLNLCSTAVEAWIIFFFPFYGSQLFFKKLMNFYFWLYWSFIAACGCSLVVELGLLVVVASLVVVHSI